MTTSDTELSRKLALATLAAASLLLFYASALAQTNNDNSKTSGKASANATANMNAKAIAKKDEQDDDDDDDDDDEDDAKASNPVAKDSALSAFNRPVARKGDNGDNGDNGDDLDDADKKKKEEGWKLSAKLNRPMLLWDDHGTGKLRHRGAYNVDSDQDNSGVALEGKFKIDNDWSVGLKVSLDAKIMHSDSVSQIRPNGNTEIELGDALVEFIHKRWGKIIVGHSESASDGTSNFNLAGSNVLADAEVENWNGSFFIRGRRGGSTGVQWGEFFAGPQSGDTGRFISYWTPKINGFEIGVSVGQPQEVFLYRTGGQPTFDDRTGGFLTDIGIKYSAIWGNAFRVAAKFGAFRDTTEESDANKPTDEIGYGGSVAVKHLGTGLNFAVNAGVVQHSSSCADPGVVSGGCRGDDKFLYLKGGIVRNFNSWGPTAIYAEHYNGWKTQHESDLPVLRAFELNTGTAAELKSSAERMWGFGLVQTFKSKGADDFATDIYIGYRNYTLDVNLLNGGGGAVSSVGIKDFSAVMAGMRFRWNDDGKD